MNNINNTNRKNSNSSIDSIDTRSYSIDSNCSGEIEIKNERKEIDDSFFIKIKSPNRRNREEPIISSSPQISDVLKLMEQIKFNNKLINKCE